MRPLRISIVASGPQVKKATFMIEGLFEGKWLPLMELDLRHLIALQTVNGPGTKYILQINENGNVII